MDKTAHRIIVRISFQMPSCSISPVAFPLVCHIALAIQQLDHGTFSAAKAKMQKGSHLFPGVQDETLFTVLCHRVKGQRKNVMFLFHERNGAREQIPGTQDRRNIRVCTDTGFLPQAIIEIHAFPSCKGGISGLLFMDVKRGKTLFLG